MRRRTRAREVALQALYELDLRGEEVLEQLDQVVRWLFEPEEPGPSTLSFALELIRGTWTRRAELDDRIKAVAENWDIRRMAVVDRNVLRLATFELLFVDGVPHKVSLNEAIDLAKRFSTADSGAFVNGILDRIRLDSIPAELPESVTEHES